MNEVRLGVIGLGHVGRALAHRAGAARMTVQGFDVSQDAVAAATAMNVAAPANALKPRTATGPTSGMRHAAIRHGIACERNACWSGDLF